MGWSIETMWWCSSNEDGIEKKVLSSDGKTEYTVYVSSHGISCDCMGFKTRHKCKHLDQVSKDLCGWNQQIEGGDVVRDAENKPHCPKCGAEAKLVRVAV